MSPAGPDPSAPTGRPTELDGTDVLRVDALVAHAASVPVPAALALADPMWALVPLIEGTRVPEAHGAGESARMHEGLPVRSYRVVVEIVDVDPSAGGVHDGQAAPVQDPDQLVVPSVQDLDDGFRQRRWLVESYTARWNELVDRANSLDDETCNRFTLELRGVLDAELQERSGTPVHERQVELERLLVRHLTGLKVLEARQSAGRVVRFDEDTLRGAFTADIREVRPYGIIDALSYEAVSAGSETASWGRDETDGRRPSTFTKDDFFRWARDASGYNRTFVTEALKAFPPTALYMGGALTKGSKGSGYPEVLGALRRRGETLLGASPARRLWAQGPAGTTIDEPARPEAVILPSAPRKVRRR